MSTIVISNIKATGETASRAVSGVAAAWVNFNGTGTAVINDSMNVASLTDNGTGNYTQTYSNAFSSNNLSFLTSSNGYMTRAYDNQTTYADVRTYGSSAAAGDYSRVHTATFGDLA